jgi:hypothetical protein
MFLVACAAFQEKVNYTTMTMGMFEYDDITNPIHVFEQHDISMALVTIVI